MKLFQWITSSLVSANWVQPNYYDARAMSFQRQSGWGHPVGVKAGADWTMCPALTPFPAGVASVNCDGATCMQICEAGKVAMGRRRIKCRWKRKKGFFWKRALSECKGCDPETPTSSDANLSMNCAINTKGFNVCLAKCTNGGKILGGKKLKLKCKCPRSNGTRTCGWVGRKAFWSAAQLSALTCEGGSASSGSGSTGSGSGSAAGATHCATGSTIITSAGVTCSDGSTPVAGTGSAPATAAPTAAPTAAATAAPTAAATAAPTAAPTAAATSGAAAATTGAAAATTGAAAGTTGAAAATTAAAAGTTGAAAGTTGAAAGTTGAAAATTAAAAGTTGAAAATTAAAAGTTGAAAATTAAAGAGATGAAAATTAAAAATTPAPAATTPAASG